MFTWPTWLLLALQLGFIHSIVLEAVELPLLVFVDAAVRRGGAQGVLRPLDTKLIDFQQKREIQITYLPVISIRFVTIFNEVVQLTLSEPELFWYDKDQGGGVECHPSPITHYESGIKRFVYTHIAYT